MVDSGYTRDGAMKPLGQIFRGCPKKWAQLIPCDVKLRREKEPALLGYVLMACAAEQCEFLACLWSPQFWPDADTQIAWKALVNVGAVPDLIDVQSSAARQRFDDTYNGVMHALNKM